MNSLLLWMLLFAAAAWAGPWGRGEPEGVVADTAMFMSPIQGSYSWVSGTYENDALDTFVTGNLLNIKPKYALGHNRVRLNFIKMTIESDVTTNRGQGARDSSDFWFPVMMCVGKNGTIDTTTEDQNGVGRYIPRAAYIGYLSMPQVPMANMYSEVISIERGYTTKELESKTYSVVWGDSVQFKAKKNPWSTMTGLTIWISYGATSYLAGAPGAPPDDIYFSQQYIDTMYSVWDYVKMAGTAQNCMITFWGYAIGGMYNRYYNSGHQGLWYRQRATWELLLAQEEDNIRFFDYDFRPVLSSLAAALSASSRTVIISKPSWWNATGYPTLASFKSSQWSGFQPQFTLFVDHQKQNGDLLNWAHTNGTLAGSSPLDSVAWRLTVGTDGTDQTPDTSFLRGAKVIISINPTTEYLGAEDPISGLYHNTSVDAPFMGPYGGVISNLGSYGIDSIGTGSNQKSSHFAWALVYAPNSPHPPLTFPGFELWCERSQRSTEKDSNNWLGKTVVNFYKYGNQAPIKSAPTVVVTSPNGGETFTTGTTYYLTWTASRQTPVSYDIKVSTDGGSTYPGTIVSGLWGGAVAYAWNASSLFADTDVRVKVVANYYGGSVEDASDGNFTINSNPQTYTVRASNDTSLSAGSSFAYGVCSPTVGYPAEYDWIYARVGVQNVSFNPLYRMYYTFDISAIPEGQTIDSIQFLFTTSSTAFLTDWANERLVLCDANSVVPGNVPAATNAVWTNLDRDTLGGIALSAIAATSTQYGYYLSNAGRDSLAVYKSTTKKIKLAQGFKANDILCSGGPSNAVGDRLRRGFLTSEDATAGNRPTLRIVTH